VGVTGSGGKLVNTYSYDPYGNGTYTSERVSNPFQFTGALLDSSTGLYKMGERYYDPSIGRFTQEDPLGNGYGYAGANPANFVDPSGQLEEIYHGGGGTGADSAGSRDSRALVQVRSQGVRSERDHEATINDSAARRRPGKRRSVPVRAATNRCITRTIRMALTFTE